MRDLLRPDEIANTIRMLRTQHKGAFLIAEGGKDARFYKRFVNQQVCSVQNAHNKQNTLTVLGILENESFPGVVAIVDTDFWRITRTAHPSPNLVLTDTHDLETLIIRTSALDKVLAELGSATKVAAASPPVRDALVNAVTPLGHLRLVSQVEVLNLKFEGLDFAKFLDGRDVKPDAAKLVTHVKNVSQSHHLVEADLLSKMANVAGQGHDPWHLCCGPDMVAALAQGLRRAWGSQTAIIASEENVGRSLRLAFEAEHFRQTKVFLDLVAWEARNLPYKLF